MSEVKVGQTYQIKSELLPNLVLVPPDVVARFGEKMRIKVIEAVKVNGFPTGQYKVRVRNTVGQWDDLKQFLNQSFIEGFYEEWEEPKPEEQIEVNRLDQVID